MCLELPPLRERPDDIQLLVEHFGHEAGHDGSMFSPEVMAAFTAHSWPGNVRELRNVVEASLALGEVSPLEGSAGTEAPPAATAPASSKELLPYRQARTQVLDAFERSYVTRLLADTGNNVSLASRRAQMDRSYLSELIRKHPAK